MCTEDDIELWMKKRMIAASKAAIVHVRCLLAAPAPAAAAQAEIDIARSSILLLYKYHYYTATAI